MSFIVRQAFEWAVKKKLIEKNPMDGFELAKNMLRKNKKPVDETQVFNDEEVKMMLSSINNRSNKNYMVPLMILYDFQSGIRDGELTTVKWTDIDNEGYIQIQRTETKYYELDKNGNKTNYVYAVRDWTKSNAGYRKLYLTPKQKEFWKRSEKSPMNLVIMMLTISSLTKIGGSNQHIQTRISAGM